MTAVDLILTVVLALLALQACYLLVFTLAAKVPQAARHAIGRRRRALVLIPATTRDPLLRDATASALTQQYPPDAFDVVVAAQGLSPAQMAELHTMGARVIAVEPVLPTKAAIIQDALQRLGRATYEFVVILDADHMADRGLLQEFNWQFAARAVAVQARRETKEQASPLSRLDAVSEAFHTTVFRAGHATLGLSATLLGTGMAFEYEFFRRAMRFTATSTTGCEKELERLLFASGHRIRYASRALVRDEKVRRSKELVQRRERRLATQWRFSLHGLMRMGARDFLAPMRVIDATDRVLQAFLVPRSVLLPLTAGVGVGAWMLGIPVLASLTPLALLALTVLLAVPMRHLRRAFVAVPGLLVRSPLLAAGPRLRRASAAASRGLANDASSTPVHA